MLMRVLLVSALAACALGQDVAGPLSYVKAGVVLAGRTIPWREIASIEERSADVAAEYAAHVKGLTAAAQFELGRWCREHGLEQAAAEHFATALRLDPAHEAALCATGSAAALVAAKAAALQPLAFADWCRDRALVEQQWTAIVGALAKDNWDREAIARMKTRTDRMCGTTLLRAPFTGRWKALVDATRHHQAKCFAVYAIDFAMVDSNGKTFRGAGKQLADYFGFDQPVLAAADGEVTDVESKFEDNVPGKPGGFEEANYVEITHCKGESTSYGHLKKASVVVKVGDRVKKGDVIARIGSSGASGMPHLHFTMDMTEWAGGEGVVLGRPWRVGGCRLVDANGIGCAIELRAARVQEGWVLDCPAAAK